MSDEIFISEKTGKFGRKLMGSGLKQRDKYD